MTRPIARTLRRPSAWLLPLLLLAATTARADDADDERAAREHYKRGAAAFKSGDFPEAIYELDEAYKLKPVPGLLYDLARSYDKLGDRIHSIKYYREYLAKSAPDSPHREAAAARLAELQAGARPGAEKPHAAESPPAESAPAEAPPAEAPPAEAPAAAPPVEAPPVEAPRETGPPPKEWSHVPIDAAPPSQPIDVRVQGPVGKGTTATLYYRAPGEADFTAVPMRKRGHELLGRIPADAVSGKSVQYYLEVKRKNGEVASRFGTLAEPNIVMVDAGAASQAAAGGEAPAEAPPAEAGRDLDSEQAPLRREGEEERPPLGRAATEAHGRERGQHEEIGAGPLGAVGWSGVGLLTAGALVAAIGGAVAFNAAYQNAVAVANDANHAPVYVFNDPTASPNDKNFQDTGHTLDYVGIACVVAGSAMAAAGATMIGLDYVKRAHAHSKSERRATPAESSLRIVPLVGARQVGLGAGFSF